MSVAFDRLGLVHANGHRALRDLSFAIGAGERIAIIGPSGAGKTSLLRIAATALRPSEGRVDVLGSNPWRPDLRTCDLAKIAERYGGGGHPVVAGISFKSDELERARTVASEVVAELQRS